MCTVKYYDIMRKSKDKKFIRYQIVNHAEEYGIKPTARVFNTNVKTVRKWLRRWKSGTMEGLEEQSRAPKNPSTRITKAQRNKVIELKKKMPSFGAKRLKRYYNLTLSDKAIRKIWKEEGLLKKKRKKHKTKNDLRAVKAAWKLCEQIDIDTKDLIDIPELWLQIQDNGLPKVQYTAREVVSGLHYVAYADERSLTYSNLFVDILINHLKSCGVSLNGSRIQTDNGSEFIGSWNAKKDSAFTKTVQSVQGLEHHTIPPGAHTWQSDVETAHRLIEDEFYEVETLRSRDDFLVKATTYNLWFNAVRKNSYKGDKTPWDIVQERDPNISPDIVALPPFYLDELFNKKFDSITKGGYDVFPHP